jgi:hypothetical protein
MTKVATVTHGGVRTGVDVTEKGKWTEQWVRKATEPPPLFDLERRKTHTSKQGKNCWRHKWITSTSTAPPVYDRPPMYDMPPVYDHSERKVEKVSTLEKFLEELFRINEG